MRVKVRRTVLRELSSQRMLDGPINPKGPREIFVRLKISIDEINQFDETKLNILSSFSMEIIKNGIWEATLESIVEPENIEAFLKEWEAEHKLPLEFYNRFNNMLYEFMIPVILPLCEKMKLPFPIPTPDTFGQSSDNSASE